MSTGCRISWGSAVYPGEADEDEIQLRRSLNLHYIDYTARLLDQELIAGTTHLGPPRKVSISMDYVGNPALDVKVQDYYGNKTPPWLCCWVVMNQVGGQIEFHQEESARYALPQLLPSSNLIDWVEKIVTHQETRCIGFQQAVDAFIMRYSKSSTSLPMHGFVQKVHKLNCLTKIRLGLILCVEEDGKMIPPSCALQTQFGQISKAASQPVEKEVLTELEKLVFSASGIGPDNAIALWASLWCLILMYRKLVRSYIAFQQFPCHVPEDYNGFPECKLEAGTHFYHYLISIYAALFRVTSPLYADFRVAATRKLLDEDESLVHAFMNLRTESFYFRQENPRVPTSPGSDYEELFSSFFDWELYCDSTQPSDPASPYFGRSSHRDLPSLITEIQPFLDHLSLGGDKSRYIRMTPGLSPDDEGIITSESMGQSPPELIRGGSTSPSDHSGSVFLDGVEDVRRRPEVSLRDVQAQDDEWTYPQAIPSKHAPRGYPPHCQDCGVCPHCRKAFPDHSHLVCTRRTPAVAPPVIRHVADVWSSNPVEERLSVSEPRFFTAKPREIAIFFTREADSPVLRASVQAYHSQNGVEENPRNAAFQRDRFPSHPELQRWVEGQIKRERSTQFEHSVQNFLLSYSEDGYGLPKHELVTKVHRMNCFFRIWKAPRFTCCSSPNKVSHAPPTVQAELRYIAWKALVSLEHDVLKLLEDCLAQQDPLKPHERMAVWASLWQLILIYRDLVIAHDSFFSRNPGAKRDPAIGRAYEDLYNVFFPLIAIFYHCQFRTPKRLEMSLDWLKEPAYPTRACHSGKIRQFAKDMLSARKDFYEGIKRSSHNIDSRLCTFVVNHELKKLSARRRSKTSSKSKSGAYDDE
ncbi:hypothetical protein ACJ41O_002602 [Fusarium nematophilum]